MKKKRCIIFCLVLFILLFSFPSFGYRFQVIKSTIPQVNVWLDEPSMLENTYIRNEEFPQEQIIISLYSDEEAEDEITQGEYYEFFAIKPKYSLSNGDYTLTMEAVDLVDNRETYEIPFSIGAEERPIRLINPQHGASQTDAFDLEIATDGSAVCKYALFYFSNQAMIEDPSIPTFDGETIEVDANGKVQGSYPGNGGNHTIKDFHTVFNINQRPTVYIKCYNLVDQRVYSANYEIYVDKTNPTINFNYDPNPIIYLSQAENDPLYFPRTNFVVEANEPVICSYSEGNSFDVNSSVPFIEEEQEQKIENYLSKTTYAYSYEGTDRTNRSLIKNLDFTVLCEDLSGRLSSTQYQQLKIDLTAPLLIKEWVSPTDTTNKTVDLRFETNKPAFCSYDLDDGLGFQSTTSSATRLQLVHEKASLGPFDDGEQTIQIKCIADKTLIDNRRFIIDNTPPVMSEIVHENSTWNTDFLEASFIANDSLTNIVEYSYRIESSLGPIMEDKIIDGEEKVDVREEDNLNLTDLSTYFWVVKAKNSAGLWSSELRSSGILIDTSLNLGVCANGEQDINEIDVDCGGECGPCRVNQSCFLDIDCITNSCLNGICVENLCGNGVIDLGEVDVDCGGDCSLCTDGKACFADTDCLSGFCSPEGICEGVSCTDEALNGDESDVDCGGFLCDPCDLGKICYSDNDCESSYCSDLGVCGEASCDDGVRNGDESDVDCGGICDKKCELNQECNTDEDCASQSCTFGACTAGEDVDSDGDRIPDSIEIEYGLDPTYSGDALEDRDGDGLTNFDEIMIHRTNIDNIDTDGDGADDGKEVGAGTNPLDPNDKPGSILLWILIFLIIITVVVGGGYYYYTNYMQKKPTEAPVKIPTAPAKKPTAVFKPKGTPKKPTIHKRKVETAHDRYLRTRRSKDQERMKIFESFGAKPKPTATQMFKKIVKTHGVKKPKAAEKPKIPEKPKKSKEFELLEKKFIKKDVFDRLGKYKSEKGIESLSKKEAAFDKLSAKLRKVNLEEATKKQKSILETDLFAKLPTSKKEIKDIISKPRVGKVLKKIATGEKTDIINDLGKIGKRDIKSLIGQKEDSLSKLSKLTKKRKRGGKK